MVKVLAVIPGLHRNAQVAYSLQFLNVDESLSVPPGAGTPDSAEVEGPEEGNTTNRDTAISEWSSNNVDEDLSSDSAINCSGCSRRFSNWNDGSLYFCIICKSCDLCEDCRKKREKCEDEKQWNEWKRFCGEGHKYIMGPIIGWRGVKGGTMRVAKASDMGQDMDVRASKMDGDDVEEISFKIWLEGLQMTWAEAWKRLWKRNVLVVNIL